LASLSLAWLSLLLVVRLGSQFLEDGRGGRLALAILLRVSRTQQRGKKKGNTKSSLILHSESGYKEKQQFFLTTKKTIK
jgi:hypothetical protein